MISDAFMGAIDVGIDCKIFLSSRGLRNFCRNADVPRVTGIVATMLSTDGLGGLP